MSQRSIAAEAPEAEGGIRSRPEDNRWGKKWDKKPHRSPTWR